MSKVVNLKLEVVHIINIKACNDKAFITLTTTN